MSAAPRGVALIGFMGAGKSTVGEVLAPRLGLPLIDLDARIEQETGQSVPRLFAERGEAGFRAAEAAALAATLREGPCVLACGGGAPIPPGAMEALIAWGLVVWLKAPMALLRARVQEGQGRPLWGPAVEDLAAARAPRYAQAQLTLDASLPPEALAGAILDRLERP
jgi:shikimate kinase